jgi:guanylate kinase
MEEVPPQGEEQVAVVIPSEVKDVYIKPTQDRRRSERLKKDTTLTTKEKNERMAKKRNLEGNYTN